MFVVGLILILLALAVVAYVWFATVDLAAVTVDLGAFSVLMTPLHLFLAGGATVLVLALGAALLAAGTRRKSARRRELRDLRARAAERDRTAERDRIRKEQQGHGRAAEPPEPAPRSRGPATRAPTEPTRPVHRDPTVPESTGDGSPRDPHDGPRHSDSSSGPTGDAPRA